VPGVVFGAAFAGVVPLCVTSVSCGGSGGVSDAGSDVQNLGVGCSAFADGANPCGVAVAFEAAAMDVEAGGDADGGPPLEAAPDAPAESGDGGGD
jgi:hypothetical protein